MEYRSFRSSNLLYKLLLLCDFACIYTRHQRTNIPLSAQRVPFGIHWERAPSYLYKLLLLRDFSCGPMPLSAHSLICFCFLNIGIAPLPIFLTSFSFVISPAHTTAQCPSQLSGHNAESDWRPRPPLEYIGMALTKFLLQI